MRRGPKGEAKRCPASRSLRDIGSIWNMLGGTSDSDALLTFGAGTSSRYALPMHPFPPASKLEIFGGDAIAQVWLDPHGVRFIFESQKQIYAAANVMQVEPNGAVWTYDCDGANGAPVIFHRLLYKRIVLVEREELRLIFRIDDGSSLIIESELGPYECGHIIMDEIDFIVF